jgi:protein involved in polysaccharide export with SLBB domain
MNINSANIMNYKRVLVFFTIVMSFHILLSADLYSQITGAIKLPKPGAMKPGEYDTVGVLKAETLAKETLGIVETAINPDTYIVGPNDIMTVFIAPIGIKDEPDHIEAIVSPDGRIVIPAIGAVHIGGLSLSKAEEIVREKVFSILKTPSVSLVLRKMRTFKVIIRGAVKKPGIISATPSDRVSEIIDRSGGLLYSASTRSINIMRFGKDEKPQSFIDVDLQKFYAMGDKSSNPFLEGGDVIFIPTLSRTEVFQVNGEIGSEGEYEYKKGDKLSTAINTAQGFLRTARIDSVEIARFDQNGFTTSTFFVDCSAWPSSTSLLHQTDYPNDILLEPGDRIYVREKIKWRKMYTVSITGEVQKPGKYAINPDSNTIQDLISRAGGLTEDAYNENSLLMRQKDDNLVYDIEYWRLLSLPAASLTDREKAFLREKKREKRGLIAVDFNTLMRDDRKIFLSLEDQDSVYIAPKKEFVNVFGKVQKPGRIKFNPSYTYEDYIRTAGGFSARADEDETLILTQRGEQLLAEADDYKLLPGDQIMVPEIPENKPNFKDIISTVLTISAQIVTVAAFIFTLSRNNP